MDTALIVLAILAVAVSVGVVFYVLSRSQQGQLFKGFEMLQTSFESFQRNVLLAQKEGERSNESKLVGLRTELASEMQLNRKELTAGLIQTTTLLEQKVMGMDKSVEERLMKISENVQVKLEQNLKEGFTHFEKVQEHLKQAEIQLSSLNMVGQSINDLNNLLKLPHLRGNFGEATLERLLSDMLPAHAFELQYRIVPNSTERVDAVIKYPTTVLPIDSKFPREQVLPLFETNDPAKLEEARLNLYGVMKGMAKSIADKYIHPEHGTTDMALLFVPSETLYFEILRNIRLVEDLGKLRIFAVSPNTLSVTLHAISVSRNYYEMARGVEKTITEVKKAQTHFESFDKRFQEIGTSLGRAQNAFSTASTHLGRYTSAVNRLVGVESTEALDTPPIAMPQTTAALLPEGSL